jgi:hypothetical protein
VSRASHEHDAFSQYPEFKDDLEWSGLKLYPNNVDWDDWDNMSGATCIYFSDLNNHDQLLGGFDDFSSEWACAF